MEKAQSRVWGKVIDSYPPYPKCVSYLLSACVSLKRSSRPFLVSYQALGVDKALLATVFAHVCLRLWYSRLEWTLLSPGSRSISLPPTPLHGWRWQDI